VIAAVTTPTQASASSLVYLKDGDVWLGAPDGSAERRLTTSGGFESPSQADDGTVVAIERGEEDGTRYGRVHRFGRKGQPLGSARCGPESSSTYTGPLGAEVAPGGKLVAFHFTRFPSQSPVAAYCPADRDAPTDEFGQVGGYLNPSWMTGELVVLFARSGLPNVVTDSPDANRETWFTETGIRLTAGAANRQLTMFAGIADGGAEVRIYRMNGPPPASPTARCSFTAPDTSDHYRHPTWSPDGRRLAWDEPDGIHVADVATLDDCSQVAEDRVIPRASDPHWGPAAAPRPCVVPKLKGKRLRRAERLLKAARCTLGRVTRREAPRKKPGRVLSQRPKPGAVRPPEAEVRVVVSKR
jgi:hypothetical protein